MPERPTLLAALAHPDDESRIIGGTLARYAAEGVRVVLYCATEGEAWRAGADQDEQRRLRRRELAAACATLGIAEVRLRAFPDGGLDRLGADVLAADIAASIRACAPHVVITFGPEGRTLHRAADGTPTQILGTARDITATRPHRAAPRRHAGGGPRPAGPGPRRAADPAVLHDGRGERRRGGRLALPRDPRRGHRRDARRDPVARPEAPGHRRRPRQPVARPAVRQRRRGDPLAGAGPRGLRAGGGLPAPAARREERPVCGAAVTLRTGRGIGRPCWSSP